MNFCTKACKMPCGFHTLRFNDKAGCQTKNFGSPEILCWGTFTLPRIVGLARAFEIAAWDKPIAAEQALSWGLITKIAAEEKVIGEAEVLVREILKGSIFSFGWSKQLLTDSFHSSFEAQLQKERQALFSCAAHEDGREGLKAFLEKRKPEYNKERRGRKA